MAGINTNNTQWGNFQSDDIKNLNDIYRWIKKLEVVLGGFVTGPASSTDSELALFNGTTGSVIKASSITSTSVVTLTGTQTLTNKRITPRTGTTTSSATPTINTDNVDFYSLTAQAADITSFTTNLSGTPTEGQTLWIAVTGTAARLISFGSSFEASTIALPTTTVSTNRLDMAFIWNSTTNKWRIVGVA